MTDVNLSISKEVVLPIVEQKIKSAIMEALGEKEQILETVIERFLNQQVDSDGKVNSYSSYNKYRYADIVLGKMINEATKEAISEWMAKNKDKIKKAVTEQLQTKSTQRQMAKAICVGIIKATEDKWSFKTEFKFQTPKDY